MSAAALARACSTAFKRSRLHATACQRLGGTHTSTQTHKRKTQTQESVRRLQRTFKRE